MITKSLAAFASPIITKAMETGGRGYSQTTTDYSGIGDALMKKAQLELNAATLKADVAMKTQAMNTEARLKMIDIEDVRMQNHLQRREESKDNTSFMEKATGVLQGVASGAATGMAVSGGNPIGGIIGGVAGGAMSADAAYGKKSTTGDVTTARREGIARTNETLGSIATIATTARGMYDKYKGNEVYKNGTKDLSDLATAAGKLTGAEKQAKIDEYHQKETAMMGEMAKYFGPQEANTMMEGFRKGQSAIMSNDPETATKAQMAQVGTNLVAALEQPGANRIQLMEQARGEMNRLNGQLYGFDNKHQISPQEFSHVLGGIDPTMGEEYAGIMSMKGGGGKQGGNTGTGGGVRGNPNYQMDPTTGAQIQQPNPNQPSLGISVPGFAGGMISIPAGRGAVMDDGMPLNAAAAETDLAAKGGEAVKALKGTGVLPDDYNELAQKEADESGVTKNPPGRHGATGSWDEDSGTPQPEKSLLEERMDEIRNSKLNKGLKEERIREIAEHQLREEGHTNIEAKADDPKMTKRLEEQRSKSLQFDQEIETEFQQLQPNLIDKDDKDGAKNILITADNLRKQEALIDRLPADSQIKAKAAEFLLNGFAEGKSTNDMLGSQFLLKGNVATVLGTGMLDSIRGKLGGIGKGSAKAVSEILSPDEIRAVEEYAQNEAMAIQALVKTGDKGVVNEGEVKHSRSIFFNHGMSKDRKQERINGMKENMVSKMRSMRRTAKPFYDASMRKEKELIHYRGDVQIDKAYEEQSQREAARRESKSLQNQIELEGEGGWFSM